MLKYVLTSMHGNSKIMMNSVYWKLNKCTDTVYCYLLLRWQEWRWIAFWEKKLYFQTLSTVLLIDNCSNSIGEKSVTAIHQTQQTIFPTWPTPAGLSHLMQTLLPAHYNYSLCTGVFQLTFSFWFSYFEHGNSKKCRRP